MCEIRGLYFSDYGCCHQDVIPRSWWKLTSVLEVGTASIFHARIQSLGQCKLKYTLGVGRALVLYGGDACFESLLCRQLS